MIFYKVINDIVDENDFIDSMKSFREKFPGVLNPTEEYMNENDYYIYESPVYDVRLEQLTTLFFNNIDLIVSHNTEEIIYDIPILKQEQIIILGKETMRELRDTEIYLNLEQELSDPMPPLVRTLRDDILIEFQTHEQNIIALDTAQEIFDYIDSIN